MIHPPLVCPHSRADLESRISTGDPSDPLPQGESEERGTKFRTKKETPEGVSPAVGYSASSTRNASESWVITPQSLSSFAPMLFSD